MRIPIESLAPETLRRVVEEFVTREGTDYGMNNSEFSTKVDQVLRQLKKGEALLVFDSESESCHILPKTHPAFREYKQAQYEKEDEISLS
jgi:uncharacterized protein YheU (UPF0270 family)